MAEVSVFPSRRSWLWAEFVGFYIGIPVVMAVALPPTRLFTALFIFMLLGLLLLARTPGFEWKELTHGWRVLEWRHVAAMALVTLVVSAAIVWMVAPQRLFAMVLERPAMLLLIMTFYPLLSALPQEVIFRPLFFRRYGAILPSGWTGVVLNAGLFSLAHLMYWSVVVAVMTFFGGLAFAWAYEIRRSFPMAFVLHAVAGCVMFAVGMGVYFYSGNVTRPF